MAQAHWFFSPLCALLLAPLLLGLINRTKAFVAGRRGPPLVQPYRDVAKCLRRGAVYGEVTSWLFRLSPVVNLATLVAALLILPFGGVGAVVSFRGDLIVLAGLFALGRFVTVLAALDTGSSFEGMGASREVHFAALAEPALLVALATLVRVTGALSLSDIYGAITIAAWARALPAMVLDHSGPDFGYIQYAAALKLWSLGALFVGLVVPLRSGSLWLDGGAALLGMAGLAVVIGLVESAMARYRLTRVPQFIVGAATLSAVAFIVLLV